MPGSNVSHEEVKDLVARCIAGEPAACDAFTSRFYPFIERAVTAQLAHFGVMELYATEINEICNDVFVKVVYTSPCKLAQIKNPIRIDAWLVTVVKYQTINHLQRRSRELGRQLPLERAADQRSAYPAPDEYTLQLEKQLMVHEMLAKLSDMDKLVLDLHYIQQKSYQEIADILGSSTQTIGSRISRAKKKLLAFFRDKP